MNTGSTPSIATVDELMDRYHAGERNFAGIVLRDAVLGSVQLENVDFTAADLTGVTFGEADLTRVCFDGATLVNLGVYDASVEGCSFRGADIRYADVTWSDWDGADFTDALFDAATFKEVGFGNSVFEGARLRGTALINCDILALCQWSATLIHTGPSYIDYQTIIQSVLAPDLKDFLLRAGMPPIFVDYSVECASAIDNPLRSVMRSAFISYGGPDTAFARKLYEALHENGVRVFFFAEHATPGKRLHRLMREGVNQHDRVVLICSEASLSRPGVLNEIEETLAREAREGGESYLIPIRLDDYVFREWAPTRPDLAQAIRDRVVADFTGALDNKARFDAALLRLLGALKR
ncbi:MAG TPA: toll/interleukin-1 receptor domain-containing protein [Longimicrobium sp.]|nr:toll/interleukin-1 receptor domain-containing protein [Longimicrobium sp.]